MRTNDSRLYFMGRIDHREDGAYFFWAASQMQARFTGTYLDITVNNRTAWGEISIGYIIDGRQGRLPLPQYNDGKDTVYRLAENLEADREHSITVFKRMSANHSYAVKDISTDGEFLLCEPQYSLSLEFYGDSVSAGEVCEADDFIGRSDPVNAACIYDNSYYAYTWQTARLLDARFNNIAQGGIAVYDKTGYFHYPDMTGMESVYDKTCYFPEGGELTQWDFSYIPDVVVFALGQNDNHNGITDKFDIDIYDEKTRRHWKDGYEKLISDVVSHYGKVKIVMLTTVLMHDAEWDDAIDEICTEMRAKGHDIYHFLFSRNGRATPGHPRRAEHAEMARELSGFIHKITTI